MDGETSMEGMSEMADEPTEPVTQDPPRDAARFVYKERPPAIIALKYVLVLALIGGGAGLGSWSYITGLKTETDNFASMFGQMGDRLGAHLPEALGLKTAAADIVAGVFMYGDAYPDFRIFYLIANTSVQRTNSVSVQYLPYITSANRKAFEAAALANYTNFHEIGSPVDPLITSNAALGIWQRDASGNVVPGNSSQSIFFPVYYLSPLQPNAKVFMFDSSQNPTRATAIANVVATGQDTCTDVVFLLQDSSGQVPASILYRPVTSNITGIFTGLVNVVFFWDSLLKDSLPSANQGITVVIVSASGGMYTYRLTYNGVVYVGIGDLHDAGMTSYKRTVVVDWASTRWTFLIYPTQALYDAAIDSEPRDRIIYILAIIAFVSLVFLLYDFVAIRTTQTLARRVAVTTSIIDEVFPSAVKDRVVRHMARRHRTGDTPAKGGQAHAQSGDGKASSRDTREYIADFYPSATILFSDLVSFTSWSATVPPSKVFEVLETMFSKFDACSRKHSVFKVETIGDAYVAAAGCPEPAENHMVQMADCALDMLRAMEEVRTQTGVDSLRVRIGLSSGPITAGVIRANNHRFQLFGDTMTRANQMESTGAADRIHLSPSTYELLKDRGTHIIEERGLVEVPKGKGRKIVTYWCLGRVDGGDGQGPPAETDSAPPSPVPPSPSALPTFQGHVNGSSTGALPPLARVATTELGSSDGPQVSL